jgi:hydrogenase maturation factor
MCMEVVARVVSLPDGDSQDAVVENESGRHRVSLALLTLSGVSVAPGDRVAVHTGLVVRRLDAPAAEELRSPP